MVVVVVGVYRQIGPADIRRPEKFKGIKWDQQEPQQKLKHGHPQLQEVDI
jgi:hypothetical protein